MSFFRKRGNDFLFFFTFVMLRQAYDGTSYEREARSADAVNVHIEHLLWNVVMCGTPDNTFTPLTDNLHVLTERQKERIQMVAHLLPLMSGEVELPKLEQKVRDWLEQIRMETMKGASVTNETARQMLKNWRKQGLIVILKDKQYQKTTASI